jgi:hypothetical protein
MRVEKYNCVGDIAGYKAFKENFAQVQKMSCDHNSSGCHRQWWSSTGRNIVRTMGIEPVHEPSIVKPLV